MTTKSFEHLSRLDPDEIGLLLELIENRYYPPSEKKDQDKFDVIDEKLRLQCLFSIVQYPDLHFGGISNDHSDPKIRSLTKVESN